MLTRTSQERGHESLDRDVTALQLLRGRGSGGDAEGSGETRTEVAHVGVVGTRWQIFGIFPGLLTLLLPGSGSVCVGADS